MVNLLIARFDTIKRDNGQMFVTTEDLASTNFLSKTYWGSFTSFDCAKLQKGLKNYGKEFGIYYKSYWGTLAQYRDSAPGFLIFIKL